MSTLSDLTYRELQAQCKRHSLPAVGKKDVLKKRLLELFSIPEVDETTPKKVQNEGNTQKGLNKDETQHSPYYYSPERHTRSHIYVSGTLRKPDISPTISSNASHFDSGNTKIGKSLQQHTQEAPSNAGNKISALQQETVFDGSRGVSQRTKSRSARRKNFVKENSDDESVEIDASAVATKIHLAKEMDDDESQS